jgi:hypothetical protein
MQSQRGVQQSEWFAMIGDYGWCRKIVKAKDREGSGRAVLTQ